MVEITGMGFGYGRSGLFAGLDLSLAPGHVYGLLGKNGAGKTTLLKILCGLRRAQQGRCRVLGHDPADRPAAMLEDLCLVAEEVAVPPLTPDSYAKQFAPLYPRFDREACRQFMAEMDVPRGTRLPKLSYGQRKKFLLAFALATGSRLLLLDEPTNGLDIPSKGQFRRLLEQAGGADRVVVVSTHQVRDLEGLIDPVIILDAGRIIFQQALAEVASRIESRLEAGEPSDEGVLYAEKTLGGYAVLRMRSGGDPGSVDLEILFNAITASASRVRSLFEGAPVTGGGPA